MPQVPLPRAGLSTTATPGYTAPRGVVPVSDVAGQQAQQLGAAMTRFGSDMASISAKMLEEQASASTKAGLNEWLEIRDNAEAVHHSKVGREAVEDGDKDVASEMITSLEAETRRIEDGLTQGFAKKLFRQAAEGHMVGVKSRAFRHKVQQTKVWEAAEDQQILRGLVDEAIRGYGKDDNWSLGGVVTKAWDMAAAQGLGEGEVAAAYVREAKTLVYTGIVEELLRDGSLEALESAKGLLKDLSTAPSRLGILAGEGGYDYESAKAAGMGPGADGHWKSRVPSGGKEGLILKSVDHPTFWKTLDGEAKAGMEWWYDKKADRWYTFSEGQTPKRKGLVKKKPPRPADIDREVASKLGERVKRALWDEEVDRDAGQLLFKEQTRSAATLTEAGRDKRTVEVALNYARENNLLPKHILDKADKALRSSDVLGQSQMIFGPAWAEREVLAKLAADPGVQAAVRESLSSIREEARVDWGDWVTPASGEAMPWEISRRTPDSLVADTEVGSKARAFAAIDAIPNISAKKRDAIRRRYLQKRSVAVSEDNDADAEVLQGVHEAFIQNRRLDFDSEDYRKQFPEQWDAILKRGLLRQARNTAYSAANEPRHSSSHYHLLQEEIEEGELAKYSWGQLWQRFQPNLHPEAWKSAVVAWEKAVPGRRAPRGGGVASRAGQGGGATKPGMEENPLVSYKRRIADLLGPNGLNRFTGETGGEDPRPKPKNKEESAFKFALEMALGERLDEVGREGGVLQWGGPGGIEAFIRNFSNRKLTHRRGQDLGLTKALVAGGVVTAASVGKRVLTGAAATKLATAASGSIGATATKAILAAPIPLPLKGAAVVTAVWWATEQIISAFTGGPTVLSSPYVEEEAWKVAEDLRQARALGDTEKVEQLTELLQSAYIEITPEHKDQTPGAWEGVEVGDKVHVSIDENTLASKKMLGVEGDPVPDYVSFYIRTQWRRKLALRILPTRDVAALNEKVANLGFNPDRPLAAANSLVSKDRLEVDRLFEQYLGDSREPGLADAWPPLDHQWMVWQELKRRYPEDFPGVGTAQVERAAQQRRASAYRQLGSGTFSLGDYLESRAGFQDVPRSSDSRGRIYPVSTTGAESINPPRPRK